MQNHDVMIFGPRLCLVPYLRHHVPKYHEWMCDPELLSSTCSDPLSLEEEYENQASWLASDDKLTFILLAPSNEHVDTDTTAAGPASANDGTSKGALTTTATTVAHDGPRRYVMIGDCNLFVPPNYDEDGVEVEVMVAEKCFRRRGYAAEAVRLLMSYAVRELGFRHFVAKILSSNEGSIKMFTHVLGFTLWKEVKVFSEVHFERRVVLPEDHGLPSVERRECTGALNVAQEADKHTVPEVVLPWEAQCPYRKVSYAASMPSITVDGLNS